MATRKTTTEVVQVEQLAPPDDSVVVVVAGVATITGEARVTFDNAMQKFGQRLYKEADLLESGHREDTSPVAQFTSRIISQAEERARDTEYITVPVPPRPRWMPWAEVIHWMFTALAGISAGLMVTKEGWLVPPNIWASIFIVSVVLGVFLTFIVRFARKDPR